MSFLYTCAKHQIMTGRLNFESCDMRVLLVMTNTTADTEQDVGRISAFSTLDEFDGSGYTPGGAALSGETVAQDDANNRAEFQATALTFATLGAGTRQIQGALLYAYIGGAASKSTPVAFIDTGGFPISANGGDITITWSAEGIIQGT